MRTKPNHYIADDYEWFNHFGRNLRVSAKIPFDWMLKVCVGKDGVAYFKHITTADSCAIKGCV